VVSEIEAWKREMMRERALGGGHEVLCDLNVGIDQLSSLRKRN
jgi:hypothetical protein